MVQIADARVRNEADLNALRDLASATNGTVLGLPAAADADTLRHAASKLGGLEGGQYTVGFLAPSSGGAVVGRLAVRSSRPATHVAGRTLISLPHDGTQSTGTSMPASTAISIAGTFSGKLEASSGSYPVTTETTAKVEQVGSTIKAEWSTAAGALGAMIGTLSGSRMSLTITRSDDCPGTFEGDAVVTDGGSRISGSFSGKDCWGTRSWLFNVKRT